MRFLRTFAVAATLPLLTFAHMQMQEPFPINSQDDPAVPANLKDNDYTSPLKADGSNFPCKGYHKQETSHVSKATYKAGGTGKLAIKGGAAHNGGSCQISLSYDNGDTWKVIKSMIGGCPLTLNYDFTIPPDAPSSTDVLLAWTWFNKVGNREMYMNCARVTVEGSTPGRHRRAQLATRQNSFASAPAMYVCNLGNGCTTPEGTDVAFPGAGADAAPAGGAASSGSGAGGSGGAPAPAAPAAPAAPSAPAAPAAPSAPAAPVASTPPAPSPATPSSGGPAKPSSAPSGGNVVIPIPQASAAPASPSKASAPAASAPAASAPAASAPAASAPAASAPAASASAALAPAASASAAPAPAAPAPAAPASGSCTAGSIVCTSTTTWSMCVPGVGSNSLVAMGSTAAGTTCVGGTIA